MSIILESGQRFSGPVALVFPDAPQRDRRQSSQTGIRAFLKSLAPTISRIRPVRGRLANGCEVDCFIPPSNC